MSNISIYSQMGMLDNLIVHGIAGEKVTDSDIVNAILREGDESDNEVTNLNNIYIKGVGIAISVAHKTRLSECIFEECKIYFCASDKVSIDFCRFKNCKLVNLNMQTTELRDTIFDGCKIEDATPGIGSTSQLPIKNVFFHMCDINHAYMSGRTLEEVRFFKGSYTNVTVKSCSIRNCEFQSVNLSYIDMAFSIVEKCNFEFCMMPGLYAWNARFDEVNFSTCYIGHSNLNDAIFIECELYKTPLDGCNLKKTTFKGTPLCNTDLTESIHKYARIFAKQSPALKTGGRLVYRTVSSNFGDFDYEAGKTYTAPYFSRSAVDDCHPGIYAGSWEWCVNHAYIDQNARIAICYVRDGDWTITGKGAIRCKKIRVLATAVSRVHYNDPSRKDVYHVNAWLEDENGVNIYENEWPIKEKAYEK